MPNEDAGGLRFIRYGAISALIVVAAGAFGAHALRSRLTPDLLIVFETGARYQMYHALALMAVGLLHLHRPHRLLVWAARLFLTGTVLFAGSLYLLAITGERWLGGFTPIGGAAFLGGWGFLALGGWSRQGREDLNRRGAEDAEKNRTT